MEKVAKPRKKKCIDESDKRIAQMVKIHRIVNNLTQDYIAAETGINQSRYCRIENAKTPMLYAELCRLAKVMQTTTTELTFMAEIGTSFEPEHIMLMETFGKFIKILGNNMGDEIVTHDEIQFFLSRVQHAVRSAATQHSD